MKSKLFLFSLVLLLFFGLLSGNVHAKEGIYEIEPHGKVVETIRLSVSDKVSGNFSVMEGTVDFFVISPKRLIVINYTRLACGVFSFCALENGNYTLCLVNSSNTTLTVQLFYFGDFEISAAVSLEISDRVATIKVVRAPFPFIEALKVLPNIFWGF